MRSSKDRRETESPGRYRLEDNERERVLADRRKASERRLENLPAEERQLLLSELPWPTVHKHS